jgi:hypothetical protein
LYGGMATEVRADPEGQRTTNRTVLAVLVVLVLVIAGIVGYSKYQEQQESDLFGDQLYCSLSGVGAFDRAPNTGKLCIDL